MHVSDHSVSLLSFAFVWVQFRLVMHYLSEMTEEQTLVMYSGHPMGLFPSLPSSPRAIITNGMVTANQAFSSVMSYEEISDAFTCFSFACIRLFQITPPEISMRRCLRWVYQCKSSRSIIATCFFCLEMPSVVSLVFAVHFQVRSNDGRQLLLHWASRDCSWNYGL